MCKQEKTQSCKFLHGGREKFCTIALSSVSEFLCNSKHLQGDSRKTPSHRANRLNWLVSRCLVRYRGFGATAALVAGPAADARRAVPGRAR